MARKTDQGPLCRGAITHTQPAVPALAGQQGTLRFSSEMSEDSLGFRLLVLNVTDTFENY